MEERDSAERQLTSTNLDIDNYKRENTILSQQLRDLGRQTRELIRIVAIHDDPSIQDRSVNEPDFEEEMATLAAVGDISDTDAIIDANLVTFRSVTEMQAQNQKLLRITRDLGRKMEEQDRTLRERVERTENEAINEAHQVILRLREELETGRRQHEGAVREREMLRKLLAQASPQNGRSNGYSDPSADTEALSDLRRMLAEQQSTHEAYRAEMTTDLNRLNEDLNNAHSDARNWEVQAAKANAQIEFLRGEICVTSSSSKANLFPVLQTDYSLPTTLPLQRVAKRWNSTRPSSDFKAL